MQNRTESKSTNEEKSTAQKISESVFKVGIVGTGVAATLYPLEVIQQQRQSKFTPTSPYSYCRPTTRSVLSVAGLFLRGYKNAAQQSVAKNALITQRDPLSNAIAGSKQELISEEQQNAVNSSGDISVGSKAVVAGTLAGLDTALTQYYKNMRITYVERLRNPAFVFPKPTTLSEYGKFYKVGLAPRFIGGVFVISGFFVSEYINKKLEGNSIYGLDVVAGPVFTGLGVGIIGNVLNMLHVNQVIGLDHTFTAPTARHIARQIMQQNGIKGFSRGFFPGAINMGLAYAAVPYFEKVADEVVIPKIMAGVQAFNRSRFFQFVSTAIDSANSTAPVVDMKKDVLGFSGP
jgi:hypothetical protein